MVHTLEGFYVFGQKGEHAMKSAASPEQLRARLGLRSSSAAQPHRNRARAVKRPGKGNRKSWKKDLNQGV